MRDFSPFVCTFCGGGRRQYRGSDLNSPPIVLRRGSQCSIFEGGSMLYFFGGRSLLQTTSFSFYKVEWLASLCCRFSLEATRPMEAGGGLLLSLRFVVYLKKGSSTKEISRSAGVSHKELARRWTTMTLQSQ